MNVAGTQSTQTTYNAYDRQSSKAATQLSSGKPAQTDSVSISKEGRAMDSLSSTDPAKPRPLPQWYVDLTPDSFIVSLDKGSPYYHSGNEQVIAAEKGIVKEYARSLSEIVHEEITNFETNTQLSYGEVLDNDKLNEELHQAVLTQIASNPRTSELMALMKEIGQIR